MAPAPICDVDMQVTKIFLIDPFSSFRIYMSSVSWFLHIVSIELTRSLSILLLKLDYGMFYIQPPRSSDRGCWFYRFNPNEICKHLLLHKRNTITVIGFNSPSTMKRIEIEAIQFSPSRIKIKALFYIMKTQNNRFITGRGWWKRM